MNKQINKDFEGYPTRQVRISKEVWEELKRQKLKSAKTWNNFIKELLNAKNGVRE